MLNNTQSTPLMTGNDEAAKRQLMAQALMNMQKSQAPAYTAESGAGNALVAGLNGYLQTMMMGRRPGMTPPAGEAIPLAGTPSLANMG